MPDEDELSSGPGISADGSGFSFCVIPDAVINVVHANVYLVWTMGNFGKTKTPRYIIQHTQRMFADEEVKRRTPLWKEHCAGDLRELADGDFHRNFRRFLRTVPERQASDASLELYRNISAHRDFLHEFHHLNGSAVEAAKTLLSVPDLEAIDEKIFDKICTNFILGLNRLFTYNPQ